MTTNAEMVNPCIIGLVPDFFILENDVLSPIAAKAQTIRNLLVRFVKETTDAGTVNMLATMAIPKNPRMNQGNIFVNLKFILTSDEPAFAKLSLVLMRNWIRANTSTVGIIERVLVNLTIVAKSPAASEKA